ncbi:unnamed protein product [Mytilus coruscus]|uniref:Reverse transcriptase/retrotransposon-derived protein RNase H-like domain-containing protein n=1 Tax=Mytilus coruscus TaxID=42192 RepID=A0A6J8DTG3_MYTCO|nr:unnamed protein product [Mytilus coruscus]
MPDVDSTLRQIAQWKHIVISDLTTSFYQIPLSRDSMKYSGVSSPFCGIRVYVRSAMGMPRSETALEELTCHLIGLLSLLENAVDGCESKDTISWTKELNSALTSAQNALFTNRLIALPRPTDQLWIVTDGALKKCGLGATLYVNRNDKLLLAGFFSTKLRQTQRQWLPCEIEALSIAAAIKHFSPYIIQSLSTKCVLTESKPCVQAFEKLCRGEFSSSPRVSTFLSTASCFQVSIRHVSGLPILPSDYSSRNAPDCDNPACQICNFIHLHEECVVRHVTTADILNGTVKLPFTSRAACLSNQTEGSERLLTYARGPDPPRNSQT